MARLSLNSHLGIPSDNYRILSVKYGQNEKPVYLTPNSNYLISGITSTTSDIIYETLSVVAENERKERIEFPYFFHVKKPALKLTTLAARATSNDCAIICAETNMSEDETGGGFEWRRYDAPELVPSTFVACPVANGHMEGKLKGLSSGTYYKYRPYYEDAEGTRTFGDWIAFYTADAYVYFEPTVYTYSPTNVTSTGAELRGYALAGSDDVTEQGFEYRAVAQSRAAEGDVQRVVVSGQRMRVQLDNLLPSTTYSVRTFATTAKGTTYGDEMTFTTAEDPQSGIETIEAASEATTERTNDVYTLQGMLVRRNATADDLRSLRPGLYIIGGRKVLIR